jgi:hypothetical protein
MKILRAIWDKHGRMDVDTMKKNNEIALLERMKKVAGCQTVPAYLVRHRLISLPDTIFAKVEQVCEQYASGMLLGSKNAGHYAAQQKKVKASEKKQKQKGKAKPVKVTEEKPFVPKEIPWRHWEAYATKYPISELDKTLDALLRHEVNYQEAIQNMENFKAIARSTTLIAEQVGKKTWEDCVKAYPKICTWEAVKNVTITYTKSAKGKGDLRMSKEDKAIYNDKFKINPKDAMEFRLHLLPASIQEFVRKIRSAQQAIRKGKAVQVEPEGEIEIHMPTSLSSNTFSALEMDLADFSTMNDLSGDFTCVIMSVNYGLNMYVGDEKATPPTELVEIVHNLWESTSSHYLTFLIGVNSDLISLYRQAVSK